MTTVPQLAPISSSATRRQSSDSAWPLRDAHGRTWAERKQVPQQKGAGRGNSSGGE